MMFLRNLSAILISCCFIVAAATAATTTADYEEVTSFKLLTSAQIYDELVTISQKYPNLATLTTAQELFHLESAGTSQDCTFHREGSTTAGSSSSSSSSSFSDDGCPNFILTIHDTTVHPFGSESERSLPEVFLSGALHGNERVGPTAVLQTAKLLLSAAQCESLPRYYQPPTDINTEEGANWLYQIQEAQDCRKELLQLYGITDQQRQWLARLVTTRRIVMVPMTNALGYDRNERTENGVDPNRDFPYDVSRPQKCMQTIAGRTVNELFQRHLFQICLTFHAGTEVIGYEWGAYPYLPTNISPDDTAQREISQAYSSFAGGFEGTDVYRTGTMNELVYAVKGGMEDWAYAGSWDTDKMIQCEPTQYGGYDKNRTVYTASTLRAFNMLIETSDDKIPKDHLGSSRDILSDSSYEYNGHVSRNIRLALTAIELVQPYVVIWGANMVPLKNDVIPSMERSGRICRQSKVMKIPQGRNDTTLAWYVGGGFTVDYTTIMYAKWDNVPEEIHCEQQLLDSDLGRGFRTAKATKGPTRWKSDWMDEANTVHQGQPMFFATIDTSMFQPGDQIAVYATAKLDQGWKYVPDGAKPNNIPPMSHLVNARTNDDWRHENSGKIIQGRQDWYSIPLTLVISDDPRDVNTTDLSDRFVLSNFNVDDPHDLDGRSNDDHEWNDTKTKTNSAKGTSANIFLFFTFSSALSILAIYKIRNWRQVRQYRRERIRNREDDEAFVNEFRTYDLELRELT